MLNKLSNLSSIKKKIILNIIDFFFIIFSIHLSFVIRLESFYIPSNQNLFIIFFVGAFLIFFFNLLKIYTVSLRFLSIEDLKKFFFINLFCSFLMFVVFLYIDLNFWPRSIFLIFFFINFFFLCSSRIFINFLFRYIYSILKVKGEFLNVIIYGAGNTGKQLAEILNYNPQLKIQYFVDDNNELEGKTVNGIKVINKNSLVTLSKKIKIHQTYIAIPSLNKVEKSEIIKFLLEFNTSIKTVPNFFDHTNTNPTFLSDLRDVRIEEFLGRPENDEHFNNNLNLNKINGKNILITGGAGSIGFELSNQLLKLNPNKIIILDSSEYGLFKAKNFHSSLENSNKFEFILGSIDDEYIIEKIFSENKINIIYHAAAFKHVDIVEKNKLKGLKNNFIGSVRFLNKIKTDHLDSFVLISTDKAVNPKNIMGLSKRLCEVYTTFFFENLKSKKNYSIVRFGNVLWSSGSVLTIFSKQIKKGGPVTVTDTDVKRYFMSLSEACQLVIQAGTFNRKGTYILDMGEQMNILEMAKKMIRLRGFKPLLNMNSENKNSDSIEIKITKLKKGEKKEEELSINQNYISTENKKIFYLGQDNLKISDNDFNQIIESLERDTKFSEKQIFQNILKVVPEFNYDK